MSVIIAGQVGAQWGLTPQTGFIAQASEADSTIEENPTKDAHGEVAWTSFYNPTRTTECGGVWLGAAFQLGAAMGALASILVGPPFGTVYCVGQRTSGLCDGFVGFHARGKQYQFQQY